MRLDHFLFGVLLFSLVFVGGSMVLYSMAQDYEVPMNETEMGLLFDGSYNESNSTSVYNIMGEIHDDTEEMKEKVIGEESEAGGITRTWDVLMGGAIGAVKTVKNSIELISVISNRIAMTIGIPSFIVTTFTAMIMLSITFAVIYMIIRFQPR